MSTLTGGSVSIALSRRKQIDARAAKGDHRVAERRENVLYRETLEKIAGHEPGDWGDLAADLAIIQALAAAAVYGQTVAPR